MRDAIKIFLVLFFFVLFCVGTIGYQIWRVKQFQKATGFGFIKAAFVLGK